MKIETVIWLLPLAFMLHDFEEIIFMNAWMSRSEKELGKRFPRIAARMIPHIKKLSPASFALCVAEEFLLLCIAIIFMVSQGWYSAFAGILGAYTIHLCVHFVQAAVFRGYIPALVTSVITAVYCGWAFFYLSRSGLVLWVHAGIWCAAFLLIITLNVALMHFAARRFEELLCSWGKGES